MPVASNFSFSHTVFHSCIFLVRQNMALCGNGLKSQVPLKGRNDLLK